MVTTTHGFSGFSVNDTEAARAFYADKLGLEAELTGMGILDIVLPGGAHVIAYPKENHLPAGFTILNLEVPDIAAAVAELAAVGIPMQRYPGMPQDELGVMRGKASGHGPDIAWFLDPSGNVLSIMET
ncbi:MAG: VOC family protein [Herbiconiux sp.]|nr:VOC family protein [Herbiconiux sp.]